MAAKSLKILIIGGSGQISGNAARQALAAGHQVWTVNRGLREHPEGAVSLIADRYDVENFKKVICEADTHWDFVIDSICFDVESAKIDIELLKDRADHFAFISTDFVFEPKHRQFPQNQDNSHYLTKNYGGTKRLCELEFLNSSMNCTIFRPCHVYGPPSQLGCLPLHSRDEDLIKKIKAGETLKLVGGGSLLQQPIFAPDLAKLILSCAGNPKSFDQIYLSAGPDIIESRKYYEIIGDVLGCEVKIEEVSVTEYLADCPVGYEAFICHRIYDLQKMRDDGLDAPSTPIEKGLEIQVKFLLEQSK